MDQTEESAQRAPCRYCGEVHPASFSHCPKTGRSLSAGRALIGRVIAGRYRVLGLIGEGGMGAVYVAEHLMIGRKVALKRLHPELMDDAKAVARFQREARAAAATGHEHIVEVIDLGFGEDHAPFLVMEYLRGQSLAELLRKEERLAPERACRIVGQLLAALSAVHLRSIVHRDLKPDNIILTHRRGDSDFVKVVDFGISKMQKEEGEALALTRTGVMLGTPFYMSPEQARGIKDLDHRVDLYAAGVILYECLAGRLPFDGDNYHQLLQAILSGKHPNVRELRPEVSEGLAAVVERAIALDRGARFSSAREMLLALVPHGALDSGAPSESAPPPQLAPSIDGEAQTTRLSSPDADAAPTTPLAALRSRNDASIEPAATVRSANDGAAATTPVRASRAQPKGLAPEPRRTSGKPRRFVAQSSDWEPEPSSERALEARAVRESAAPFAREESSSLRLRPLDAPSLSLSMSTPSETGSDPTRVKGSLLLSALETIGEGARARVLSRLEPGLAAQLSGVILPMAWLPLTGYVELLRTAERELAMTEGAFAVRVGRATADHELTSTHRLFMQSATPAMAVERIPQIFRAYHGPGRAEIERATGGSYRVITHGLSPDTMIHALAMSGFYHRLLELAGAQDVRTGVVACRERGDEATVTTLRWR